MDFNNLSFIIVSLNSAGIELVRRELPDRAITICQSFSETVNAMTQASDPANTVLCAEIGIPFNLGGGPNHELSYLLPYYAASRRLGAVIIGENRLQFDSAFQAMRSLADYGRGRTWYYQKYALNNCDMFTTAVFFRQLPDCQRSDK